MARKKTALAQNATETRVLPVEVVRPVFRTKGAEKRALEQEQEERAWDRFERVVQGFLASPAASTLVFGAVGAMSGVAGTEPFSLMIVDGPSTTGTLGELINCERECQSLKDGTLEGLKRYAECVRQCEARKAVLKTGWRTWTADFIVQNTLTSLLSVDTAATTIDLGFLGKWTAGGVHFGWPNRFQINALVPRQEIMEDEKALAAVILERKCRAMLRAQGAGSGAAFGLGMAALAGAVSGLRKG